MPKDSCPPISAYIAFGSNLGDRRAYLSAARNRLCATAGIDCIAASSLYESLPSGGPEGQGLYLNAVVRIMTSLEPVPLLHLLQEIERENGRSRGERWAARTLDLDLLIYGELILTSESLTLPHPRLQERAFVLLPCREIAPELLHPLSGKSMSELSAAIDLSGTWKTTQRW